jgi:hypothetical protein
MGYRSEVAFVISFETKEELDNYLAPRLLDDYIKHTRDKFTRVDSDPASVMFHYTGWKWYEGHPEIEALTNLYREAEEEGGAYTFIRIGEDDADIETEYGISDKVDAYQEDFYPVRYINIPSTHKLTFGEEQ